MFVNRHKQLNIIESCKRFLKKIKELKLYLVEFDKNSIIKNKTYLFDYILGSKDL